MQGNGDSSMEKGEVRLDHAEKQMIVMIPTTDGCNSSSTANGAADVVGNTGNGEKISFQKFHKSQVLTTDGLRQSILVFSL